MANNYGWAGVVGSPGGASKLGAKHGRKATRGKKHRTSKGMVGRKTTRHARG
jgi:hypothetical protein